MLATERTVATLLVASLAAAAAAQCPNAGTWAPLDAHAAPFGSVHALLAWDPDGPGPLGEHVVCGGAFSFVGSQAIANVALYDPATQTYAPMGAGFDGPVRALALFGNDVIAAGDFSASGATAVSNLARWNGAAWGDVGGGVTGPVHALEAAGATLYVGGAIVQAGGLGASGLAAWDGQSWSATALGVVRFQQNPAATLPGVVHGLAFDAATGRLYVGGAFDRAGATVLANGVASWDGAAWSSLGHAPRTFEAMTLRANGELWLSSTDSSNLSQLFRWNGAALLAVGQPEQTGFALLDELTNGTLVGGRSDYFTAFGEFAEWTGAAWMPRQGSELLGLPRAFLELGIGDELLGMERTSGDLLAMRRGTAGGYGPPASGRDGIVRSLIPDGDGALICGDFTQLDAIQARGVGRYEAGAWSSLGGGVHGLALDVCRLAGGGVAVGGQLTAASGPPFGEGVMLWDGVQWQPLSCPLDLVLGVEAADNGDLLAAGWIFSGASFLARWDGVSWTLLPQVPSSVGRSTTCSNGRTATSS